MLTHSNDVEKVLEKKYLYYEKDLLVGSDIIAVVWNRPMDLYACD